MYAIIQKRRLWGADSRPEKSQRECPAKIGENNIGAEFSNFCGARMGGGGEIHNFRKNLMLVGAGGPGALQTSPEWAETVLERNFPTSAGRGWEGGAKCTTSARI